MPTPPEQATPDTVEPEWWTSGQLAAHLGYRATGDANQWFNRHEAAGHFQGYEQPRRPLPVNRKAGAGPTSNRWQYWAPACVEIRERSVRGSSRLT